MAPAALACAAALAAAAPAGAAVVGSDMVSFATTDQPVWSSSRSGSFDLTVVDTGPVSRTLGSIGTVNIANPNYASQVAACGLLNPACVAAVPLTIAVADGERLRLSSDITGGFRGEIAVLTNLANVSYSASVDIAVSKPDAAPGELNFLSLAPRDEAGSIGTRLAGLAANITGYMDETHSVELDVFRSGDHLLDVQHTQTNPNKVQEILDLNLGTTDAIVAAFGGPAETVSFDTSFKKTVRVPVPNTGGAVQLPVGDVTVYTPNIDLEPPGSVLPADPPDFPRTYLQNEKPPTDRFGVGKLFEGDTGDTEVDFARLQVDGNVWCLGCTGSIAFEVPTTFPIPTVAGIEIRPANTDIGSYFGIGQSGFFDPNLKALILFSKPVDIVDPVLGTYSATSLIRPVDGSSLGFVMPDGDLDIDILYTLQDNTFTDVLDLLASPARTITTLGVELYGQLFKTAGIDGEYALFTDTFPIVGQPGFTRFGDPVNVGNLFTEETTLDGFGDRAGSRLSFRRDDQATAFFVQAAAVPVAVPEPRSIVILALGLGCLWLALRRPAMR